MNITIETINVENLHLRQAGQPVEIPPMVRAFISALVASATSQDAPPSEPPSFPEVPAVDGRPRIGEYWPEQGGIYIGSRLIGGEVHHVVIPGGVEFDHIDVPFSRVEKVVNEGDELNGHSDWRAPDQEDLMLAYINAKEHFDKDGWYWSRSEHHGWPWAVYFELGTTARFDWDSEFRVRPFRRVVIHD